MRNCIVMPKLFNRVFIQSNNISVQPWSAPLLISKAGLPFIHCRPILRNASNKAAAACYKINEPLKIKEVKEKTLSKGEVRIKVNYCALNPRDLLVIDGIIPAKLPVVPGYEVAGEVVERIKGDDDDESENPIEVGDKVVALTKSWLGGLRTYCVAPEKDVWKYNTLEPKLAAGLIVNYGHALLSLFRRGKIKKDKVVVVTADTGGRGLAGLDIAANVYKAKVIGVCGTSEMADLMREKGAWSALVMDEKLLKASVWDIAGEKGVDIVYETVGGKFLAGAMKCVKHEGVVIIGDIPDSEDIIKPADWYNLPHTFNMTALSLLHYREHDFPVYRQALTDVIELCEQHLMTPDVPYTYDFEDVNDAVKQLRDHKILGKILVKLPS